MHKKNSSTLNLLLAKFNGQILIPFVDAVASVGFQEQSARNQLSKGTFPIPSVLSGSRRLIHVEDLANFIEGLRAESQPSQKTRRGRPTKASQMAKRGVE